MITATAPHEYNHVAIVISKDFNGKESTAIYMTDNNVSQHVWHIGYKPKMTLSGNKLAIAEKYACRYSKKNANGYAQYTRYYENAWGDLTGF